MSPSSGKPGILKAAARSFQQWWAPTCTEDDSEEYRRRTLEEGPEDRAPSILFEHIESNSPDWQEYLKGRERFDEEYAQIRKQANDRDVQRAIESMRASQSQSK